MSHFTELVDLASERVGGVALAANDEFFAPKENLLKPSMPVFLEDKYTDRGKWVDGWETRRRREPGHDWCLIRLGVPGVIRGVVVDTTHFKGNYPAQCSLEACVAQKGAGAEELLSAATPWAEVLLPSDLQGDTENLFSVESPYRFTHIRFNIFPDGGVARLRIFGEPIPNWKQLISASGEIDLAAVENGGLVVAASDMFFGSRHNMIMPGRAKKMSDGWETRRRRGPGYDWAVIRLGTCGSVERIVVDTSHFKGNYPESCSVEGRLAPDASLDTLLSASDLWQELLPRTKLAADTEHSFQKEIKSVGPVTHIRLNIFPDGGVSRLRIFGRVSSDGRQRAGLQWLNTLLGREAEAALLACCGSTAWAGRMAQRRSFRSLVELLQASDEICRALERQDWLEAFRAHPRIGEKRADQEPSAAGTGWSEQEQAGTRTATGDTLAALREANRLYEARFGHIFIVCATGKTAEETLALLRQRLQNDPETEVRIAAEEQRRIAQLRLEKLLQL